jgi:iron complex outermembrane receptor protein
MDQQAQQDAYPAFFMPAFSGSSSRSRGNYDFGVHYQTSNWSAYAKTGTSVRFANTDELFAFDPFTGNPVFGGDILPQRARNNEIGAYFHAGTVSGQLALYRMTVKDEIGYDGNLFANVNFDPTLHQGLETDLSWNIDNRWRTRLAYSYTDASFRSGAYDSQQIPMVARNKATAQLFWKDAAIGEYSAQLNFVDKRHVSGDFSNTRDQLPAYVTLDARASWNFKPVQISATALNLLDKRYAPYGLYSTFKSDYYFFPADGRTLFVSAKIDFK